MSGAGGQPVFPGLEGRLALVTGGSRGIGREIARALAAAGARVWLTARTAEAAEQAAAAIVEHGGWARGVALDLSDPERAAQACQEIARETRDDGGISLLVLNAGMTRDGLILRMGLEAWREVIDANLTGAFVVTKALVPAMIRARFGRIVALSSVVARTGNPGQAKYCASKAGLHGFVRALARELASRSITVNAVAPGFIETDMTRALPEATRKGLLDQVPLGRLGTPEDVAGAVLFLLSDLAAYVTGEVIDVNGGMAM
ncbi:MAG: 3-oxoacyl-[acyl-carrier-protein] reductase [Acidobacteria bacterium]|nr:MAG: 3-oxoacyl-[acyl-carrier-protein] reductase [Acidobacteriota bacterium]